MSEEIKGQLSYIEKRTAKNNSEYYTMTIAGVKLILYKPSDDAFQANATTAHAWEVCEYVDKGAVLQGAFETRGNFNHLIELEVLKGAPAESVEKPSKGEDKAYWEAKENREDRRSALHAAVAHAQGKDTKSGEVVQVAEAFYKFIREIE